MTEQDHKEEVVMQVQSAVAPLATIIHEVKDVLTAHINNEKARIGSIDDRLDKHLEIYANNGKEAKRVADTLAEILKREQVREERSVRRDEKIDEMWKKHNDDRIVAEADKKRLQTVILYGGAAAAVTATMAFLIKLGA